MIFIIWEVVEWSKALTFFNSRELEPKTPTDVSSSPSARSLVPPRFAPRSKMGTL